ncbi:unnamed protein product [Lota lota]
MTLSRLVDVGAFSCDVLRDGLFARVKRCDRTRVGLIRGVENPVMSQPLTQTQQRLHARTPARKQRQQQQHDNPRAPVLGSAWAALQRPWSGLALWQGHEWHVNKRLHGTSVWAK